MLTQQQQQQNYSSNGTNVAVGSGGGGSGGYDVPPHPASNFGGQDYFTQKQIFHQNPNRQQFFYNDHHIRSTANNCYPPTNSSRTNTEYNPVQFFANNNNYNQNANEDVHCGGVRFAKPPPRHQYPSTVPIRFHNQQQQQRRRSSGEPTKTLFVGNLAIDVGEECLHQLFSKFGEVTECCKRWFHYAFVRFDEENQAERALRTLDGYKIAGRPMRVEFQRRKLNGNCQQQQPQQQQLSPAMPRFYAPHQQSKRLDHPPLRNPFAGLKYAQKPVQEEEYVPALELPFFPFAEKPDETPDTFSIFSRPNEKIVYRNDYKPYELFPKDGAEHPLVYLFRKYKTASNAPEALLEDLDQAWKVQEGTPQEIDLRNTVSKSSESIIDDMIVNKRMALAAMKSVITPPPGTFLHERHTFAG
ncbi:hypothetical protein ACOME3_001442 [Neoechinorhynchus agilis]